MSIRWMAWWRFGAACLMSLFLHPGTVSASNAVELKWRVVATYPHDRSAFTQGLLLHDGRMYESTGLRGRSQVRIVEPMTGKVLRARDLDPSLFGEGLARVGDRLFQLTWTAGVGRIYALDDLRVLGEFRYAGEGWGLAHEGGRLFMSDGTDRIRIMDPEGFKLIGVIRVRDGLRHLRALNELEFARGSLFANVWGSDRVARIDPQTGQVTGWLNLAGLLGPARAGADVLNGIAYDASTDRFWVTGKLWPRMFVLEVASR